METYQVVALFADRATGQWVVRDRDGRLWSLPATEHPWDGRQPYTPAEGAELEPVPGHYLSILGLKP